MQIDTAAAIDLSKEKKQNESSLSDQMKAYIKHPGSGVLALLTLLGAVLTFALLFFLIGYILVKGVPYLSTDLFSLTYNSENLSLLPSLINTFILTVVSLVIAAPLGIFAAIYLVEYAKKGSKLVNVIRITAETLSGIPSIVYGFFGLVVLVPVIRTLFQGKTNGSSILTSSILLGMMILPTIIGVTESSLRTVSRVYFEGALALGATKERSIFTVMIPAAKSGIMAGVVLGIGRAIGETMAVMMVAGNQARVPNSILQGVRTLTTNIVLEMGYATGLHREALIATGVVLFVFILIINLSLSLLNRRSENAN